MIERELVKEYQVSSWDRVSYTPDAELLAVEEELAKDPENTELWVKKGLVFAKAFLYREAGECYARAIAINPFEGILYRHRGHRFLSQWRFEDASADFTIASRLIPENWDVWYHLGLSHFLLGDYDKAVDAYQRCLELSASEDELIAICDWYYMAEVRRGNLDKAVALLDHVKEDFDPGENTAYFRRLLMYKGVVKPEEVLPEDLSAMDALELITMGFGLSNYYYYNGQEAKSKEVIDLILKSGDENECYFAFGYLAAMADKKARQA